MVSGVSKAGEANTESTEYPFGKIAFFVFRCLIVFIVLALVVDCIIITLVNCHLLSRESAVRVVSLFDVALLPCAVIASHWFWQRHPASRASLLSAFIWTGTSVAGHVMATGFC